MRETGEVEEPDSLEEEDEESVSEGDSEEDDGERDRRVAEAGGSSLRGLRGTGLAGCRRGPEPEGTAGEVAVNPSGEQGDSGKIEPMGLRLRWDLITPAASASDSSIDLREPQVSDSASRMVWQTDSGLSKRADEYSY